MKKLIITALICCTVLFMTGCDADSRFEQDSFSAGEDILKRITDDNFFQEPEGVDGSGVTFYTSSNDSVASIDKYTGEIEILSIGSTYITVTNTGSSMYKPATDMYKLTIADTEFIFTGMVFNDYTFTIPVYDEYDYDYTIEWGDGGISSGTSKTISHTYENPGVFTISISGKFPGICFNDGSYTDTITSIENWGTVEWQSMNGAFYGCSNMSCNAADYPDVSDVTDMDNAFNGAQVFSGQDLSDWDVSNVTTHVDFSTDWGSGNTEPVWQ